MATTKAESTPTTESIRITWAALSGSEIGDSASAPQYPDKCVQAAGAFTSITMEGSNDGTNWATLHKPDGTDLIFSAAGLFNIAENALRIRPNAVGAGAGCTVSVFGKGT